MSQILVVQALNSDKNSWKYNIFKIGPTKKFCFQKFREKIFEIEILDESKEF